MQFPVVLFNVVSDITIKPLRQWGHDEFMDFTSRRLFLKKILEDISPFRGTTDTPVLDFW